MDLSCFAGDHGLHITMVDKTIVHGKSMMPLSEPNNVVSTDWEKQVITFDCGGSNLAPSATLPKDKRQRRS